MLRKKSILVLYNPVIIWDDSFESESMLSARQIMFKIYSEKLVQGQPQWKKKVTQIWRGQYTVDSSRSFL